MFVQVNGAISSCLLIFTMKISISAWCGDPRTHVFDIVHKGESSGQLKIVEKPTPSQTSYKYIMDMTTRFLFKSIHVEYNMDAVYKRGQLISYHLIYKLNDKLMDEVDLKWEANRYIIKTASEEKEHFKKIRYSTILLFCKQPIDRPHVWGELICENSPVSRIKDDHYQVDISGSKYNEYYYKEGRLMRACIHTTLVNFDMVRVD
jgi:hypothetical protein